MKTNKKLLFVLLMLSGEVVFLLPFLVTRVFRPTFLNVFEINNFELGSAFSVYGVVAFVSYFFGGPIADRFQPRLLLSVSLMVTSLAGFVMAAIPTLTTLTILYGFWGFSSILLFWAAFIKATRVYGGDTQLGFSYGVVDAGRGLTAAILASIAVYFFNYFISNNTIEMANQKEALASVIKAFSIFTLLVGVLLFLVMPVKGNDKIISPKVKLKDFKRLLSNKNLWLQSIVVLCAYVGYKSTDDFSLYAKEVMLLDEVNAAKVGTISFWMRPIAAVVAGWLGDRFLTSKMVTFSFALLLIGSILLASGITINAHVGVVMILIASTSASIYGLRALYFTLFKQSKVSLAQTGTAVGLISVIGYTPDIFFGPLMGYVLDANPGQNGHQYLFLILAAFSVIGIIASFAISKRVNAENAY